MSARLDAYVAWHRADRLWSAALHRAFGKAAGDRRYDGNKAKHPVECREAEADFDKARDVYWEAVHAEEQHP